MRDHLWFRNICEQNSFIISEEKLDLLKKFVNLLLSKNQEVNLISQKSEESVWEDHILHSLSFLFFIKLKPDALVLDLGSGGGLPGIPLKILYPDMDITLLDSTKKKIIADNEIIKNLDLKNIKGISARAEEIHNSLEYKNKFDYVIARAVSTLDNILKWAYPFLKSGNDEKEYLSTSSIIVLKGGDIIEEVGKIEHDKKIKEIKIIPVDFKGSNILRNPDKKLVILKIK